MRRRLTDFLLLTLTTSAVIAIPRVGGACACIDFVDGNTAGSLSFRPTTLDLRIVALSIAVVASIMIYRLVVAEVVKCGSRPLAIRRAVSNQRVLLTATGVAAVAVYAWSAVILGELPTLGLGTIAEIFAAIGLLGAVVILLAAESFEYYPVVSTIFLGLAGFAFLRIIRDVARWLSERQSQLTTPSETTESLG